MLQHARESPDQLDMGTGGGEWLAALSHRPPRTVATESWPPSLEVAGARLRPLGVTVVSVDAAPDNVDQPLDKHQGRLPFPGGSFALVTNRHESFLASEVARVLAPGGTFLTQQLGGDYGDFFEALGLLRPRVPRPHWTARFAAQQLEAAGLTAVGGDEALQEMSFADVGAFAWYLKAIPWVVESFSIARYRPQLERLHQRLDAGESLTVRLPAFWVKAVKYS